MKQLTKLIFLLTSIVALSACSILSNQSKKEEYKGYIERVSEVYPTEKVSDLFKKFPNGFEIEHIRTEEVEGEIYKHKIYLEGDAGDQSLRGRYEKTHYKSGAGIYETIVEVPITYTDEEGMMTSEPYEFEPFAKSIKFLFTMKNFSKEEIDKLDYNTGGGNPLLEDNFSIRYLMVDQSLNTYLGLPEGTEQNVIFSGRKHITNEDRYYLKIVLSNKVMLGVELNEEILEKNKE